MGSLTIATSPSVLGRSKQATAPKPISTESVDSVATAGSRAHSRERHQDNRQVAAAREPESARSPRGLLRDRRVERVPELVDERDLAHEVASICIRLFSRASPRCTRWRALFSVQSSRAAISA